MKPVREDAVRCLEITRNAPHLPPGIQAFSWVPGITTCMRVEWMNMGMRRRKDLLINQEDNMKKVEAMIQLSEVDEVKGGLTKIGIQVMTVTEVRTFGKQCGTEIYKGRRYEPPFVAEAKLELVVPDEISDNAVAVIRETSHSNEPWDTRIFVLPLDNLTTPRIAEKDIAAA
jgi:nitrogen regulatory protein P-II 1